MFDSKDITYIHFEFLIGLESSYLVITPEWESSFVRFFVGDGGWTLTKLGIALEVSYHTVELVEHRLALED